MAYSFLKVSLDPLMSTSNCTRGDSRLNVPSTKITRMTCDGRPGIEPQLTEKQVRYFWDLLSTWKLFFDFGYHGINGLSILDSLLHRTVITHACVNSLYQNLPTWLICMKQAQTPCTLICTSVPQSKQCKVILRDGRGAEVGFRHATKNTTEKSIQ